MRTPSSRVAARDRRSGTRRGRRRGWRGVVDEVDSAVAVWCRRAFGRVRRLAERAAAVPVRPRAGPRSRRCDHRHFGFRRGRGCSRPRRSRARASACAGRTEEAAAPSDRARCRAVVAAVRRARSGWLRAETEKAMSSSAVSAKRRSDHECRISQSVDRISPCRARLGADRAPTPAAGRLLVLSAEPKAAGGFLMSTPEKRHGEPCWTCGRLPVHRPQRARRRAQASPSARPRPFLVAGGQDARLHNGRAVAARGAAGGGPGGLRSPGLAVLGISRPRLRTADAGLLAAEWPGARVPPVSHTGPGSVPGRLRRSRSRIFGPSTAYAPWRAAHRTLQIDSAVLARRGALALPVTAPPACAGPAPRTALCTARPYSGGAAQIRKSRPMVSTESLLAFAAMSLVATAIPDRSVLLSSAAPSPTDAAPHSPPCWATSWAAARPRPGRRPRRRGPGAEFGDRVHRREAGRRRLTSAHLGVQAYRHRGRHERRPDDRGKRTAR